MKHRWRTRGRGEHLPTLLLIGLVVFPVVVLHRRQELKRQQEINAANIAKLRQGRTLWAFATKKTEDDIAVAVKAEVTQQPDGHYCLKLQTISVVEVVTTSHVLHRWEELESFLASNTILRISNLKEV